MNLLRVVITSGLFTIGILMSSLLIGQENVSETSPHELLVKPDSTKDEILENWIENEIQKAMAEHDVPAMSVVVLKDGEVFLKKGYGFLKRDGDKVVNELTLYQIASVSKTFTGIITNSLTREGIIDPEESVVSYLPETLSEKTKEKLKPIKIRNVLHHTSGLPRDSKVVKRKDGDPMISGYSEADLLQDLEKLKLKSKPGIKRRYSNIGYALIGYILERASGETYKDLLETYCRKNLNMENTTTILSAEQLEVLATPYRKDKKNIETQPWKMGEMASAGGIYTNIDDFSEVLVRMIGDYRIYIKSGEYSDLILTKVRAKVDDNGNFYGFGLSETETTGGSYYGHLGDIDGYAAGYVFNAEKNIGVAFLVSCGGDWAERFPSWILKKLSE